MEDIKAYWIDFVEGRITVPEFIEYTDKHPEVLDYLTKIADPEWKTCIIHKGYDEQGQRTYTPETLPFDAKLTLHSYLSDSGGRLGNYLNIHGMFSRVLTQAFPNDQITIDQTLSEKFCFMLNACPEYLGGEEVEDLLENLLESLPKDASKTKRIKLYKEQLRALFHVEKSKYPRWVQAPEWPMGKDGIPMRFISQKRKRGKGYENMLYTVFLFEDVTTGEQRTVDQFT